MLKQSLPLRYKDTQSLAILFGHFAPACNPAPKVAGVNLEVSGKPALPACAVQCLADRAQ